MANEVEKKINPEESYTQTEDFYDFAEYISDIFYRDSKRYNSFLEVEN